MSSTGSVGWRGPAWPVEQAAGGIPQSQEGSGWWHLGEVGGAGRRTERCWHRLCSHQRALPTQLTLLGYAAYQRPSCSNWPQLPHKIFICKHLKTNHACMGRDEFQVLSRSTGIQAINLTQYFCSKNVKLTLTKLITSLKELLWAGQDLKFCKRASACQVAQRQLAWEFLKAKTRCEMWSREHHSKTVSLLLSHQTKASREAETTQWYSLHLIKFIVYSLLRIL